MGKVVSSQAKCHKEGGKSEETGGGIYRAKKKKRELKYERNPVANTGSLKLTEVRYSVGGKKVKKHSKRLKKTRGAKRTLGFVGLRSGPSGGKRGEINLMGNRARKKNDR